MTTHQGKSTKKNTKYREADIFCGCAHYLCLYASPWPPPTDCRPSITSSRGAIFRMPAWSSCQRFVACSISTLPEIFCTVRKFGIMYEVILVQMKAISQHLTLTFVKQTAFVFQQCWKWLLKLGLFIKNSWPCTVFFQINQLWKGNVSYSWKFDLIVEMYSTGTGNATHVEAEINKWALNKTIKTKTTLEDWHTPSNQKTCPVFFF